MNSMVKSQVGSNSDQSKLTVQRALGAMQESDAAIEAKKIKARQEALIAKDKKARSIKIYKSAMEEAASTVLGVRKKPSKHHDWFMGHEDAVLDDPEEDEATKVARQFMLIMKKNLEDVGHRSFDQFNEKISVMRNKFQKSIKAGMLPGSMTHGTCLFGQVAKKKPLSLNALRFYVTNAYVSTDKKDGKNILKIEKNDVVTTMYYGLAQQFSRNGNYKGMMREHGDNGIMFITDCRREALYNIASLSTGRTIDQLRAFSR